MTTLVFAMFTAALAGKGCPDTLPKDGSACSADQKGLTCAFASGTAICEDYFGHELVWRVDETLSSETTEMRRQLATGPRPAVAVTGPRPAVAVTGPRPAVAYPRPAVTGPRPAVAYPTPGPSGCHDNWDCPGVGEFCFLSWYWFGSGTCSYDSGIGSTCRRDSDCGSLGNVNMYCFWGLCQAPGGWGRRLDTDEATPLIVQSNGHDSTDGSVESDDSNDDTTEMRRLYRRLDGETTEMRRQVHVDIPRPPVPSPSPRPSGCQSNWSCPGVGEFCYNGVCRYDSGIGSMCQRDDDCGSLGNQNMHCSYGTCQLPVPSPTPSPTSSPSSGCQSNWSCPGVGEFCYQSRWGNVCRYDSGIGSMCQRDDDCGSLGSQNMQCSYGTCQLSRPWGNTQPSDDESSDDDFSDDESSDDDFSDQTVMRRQVHVDIPRPPVPSPSPRPSSGCQSNWSCTGVGEFCYQSRWGNVCRYDSGIGSMCQRDDDCGSLGSQNMQCSYGTCQLPWGDSNDESSDDETSYDETSNDDFSDDDSSDDDFSDDETVMRRQVHVDIPRPPVPSPSPSPYWGCQSNWSCPGLGEYCYNGVCRYDSGIGSICQYDSDCGYLGYQQMFCDWGQCQLGYQDGARYATG